MQIAEALAKLGVVVPPEIIPVSLFPLLFCQESALLMS